MGEREMKWWRKALKSVGNWLAIKNKDEWLKDMKGNLSLVATVITTMTFQTAINPPDGVMPANETGDLQCPSKPSACPGEAVLAATKPDAYIVFLISNTICFLSSLAVCLLLVSGFPLNNRFFTWLFSIAMCITIISLSLTYFYAAQMVIPDNLWGTSDTLFNDVFYIWTSLLGLVTFVLFLRLMIWIVTELINRRKALPPT